MKKLLSMILLSVILAAGYTALAEPCVLTVKGTGIVSMEPDTASITVGVRTTASDVVEAQTAVNQGIDAVIAKYLEMGVEKSDIYTSSISIYPDYDYMTGEPLSRYTAENDITLTTKDMAGIGEYIDAAFEAGANLFGGISFSASNVEQPQAEALKLAIKQAFSKAEVMSECAGGTVGTLISLSEAEYSYAETGALYAKDEAAAAGGTTIYTAPLNVTATVTAQFELVTGD